MMIYIWIWSKFWGDFKSRQAINRLDQKKTIIDLYIKSSQNSNYKFQLQQYINQHSCLFWSSLLIACPNLESLQNFYQNDI